MRPSSSVGIALTVAAASLASSCFLVLDYEYEPTGAGGSSGVSASNGSSMTGCGELLREGKAECDDGNQDDTDGCTTECKSAVCGDGFVRAGVEECDPGSGSAPGCSGACTRVGIPFATTAGRIGLIGIGVNEIAFLDIVGEEVCVLDRAQTTGPVSCGPAGTGCRCAGSAVPEFDSLGTHLAVGKNGVVYYSPQGADTANPVWQCDGMTCSQGGIVDPMNQVQMNGLTFIGDDLYGVRTVVGGGELWWLPGAAGVWQGSDLPEEGWRNIASSKSPSAQGSPRVALSTQGRPGGDVVYVLTLQELLAGAFMRVEVIEYPESTASISIALPNQEVFARVRDRNGAFRTLQGKAKSPRFESLGTAGGLGLAATPGHVYFYAGAAAAPLRVYLCTESSANESCQPISGDISDVGAPPDGYPIEADEKDVFYTDGTTLYRYATSP